GVCDRNDAVKSAFLESKLQPCASTFGPIAVTPKPFAHIVRDLDLARVLERLQTACADLLSCGLERHYGQSDPVFFVTLDVEFHPLRQSLRILKAASLEITCDIFRCPHLDQPWQVGGPDGPIEKTL